MGNLNATATQPRPRFSEDDACTLARDLFGITATARPLPSERDQNFLLQTDSGPEFVLKIANASEVREVLEAQNAALEHVARHAPSLRSSRLRTTSLGERIGTARRSDGSTYFIRLLTYLPGHLLVEVSPHTPELLHSLGAFFGLLDQELASFSHPALKRELQWDLKHAGTVLARNLEHIADPQRRALVEHFLERFRKFVELAFPNLRSSVIHNDGNDHNVLVTGIESLGGKVTGVVDFGDLVESYTVFEPAVCAAYAILGKSDPVAAASQVVGGYYEANPLTELEIELLYDLMAMRLCTSVALSASRKRRDPDNAYLTISEGPAWAALERLAQLSPRLFHYAFRSACGLAACPRTAAVVGWLEANAETLGPVVEPAVRKGDYLSFDLGAGSAEFADIGNPADTARWTEALFGRMKSAGVRVGVGRYNEARRSYTTEEYRPAGSDVEEWRTVHLGIDLFIAPSSPVFAPLDGTVHSFANNARSLDYGPTIILRHDLPGVGEFFTLYGHLSADSLEGLSPGMPVAKGARIGAIGDSSVNGQWPPHLHFQIITDLLDQSGTFPGVCAAQARPLWHRLCPDPNLVLRIPNLSQPLEGRSPQEILEARQRHLGGNLSVSYEKPLKIVHGWRQHLYDHLGREYLDAVNNVAHVGHCHPAVVRAAQQQMAVLNTNTRYLHDHLVEYAE
ncbi:MAG: phosphotransferase, partial [Nitrospiraceae bacterium]